MPLRKAILDYKPVGGDPNRERSAENAKEPEAGGGAGNNNFNNNENERDMLYELHLLFKNMMSNKKKRGAYNHKRFILALKASNALFDNDEHHDSHEFINWLLDKVHEDFIKAH